MYDKHDLQVIVLAAGKSSRFESDTTKLTQKICGQEMVIYPLKIMQEMEIPIITVVGHQKNLLKKLILKKLRDNIDFVEQKEQKGTGHAVLCSKKLWSAKDLIIVNGDTPLIKHEVFENLIETHKKNSAAVSIVSSKIENPKNSNLGRIVKCEKTKKICVIEAYELNEQQKNIKNINAGIYIVKRSFLETAITKISPNKKSREINLPEIISLANQMDLTVKTVEIDLNSVRSVNTASELEIAKKIKQAEILSHWKKCGVQFKNNKNSYIDISVKIGNNTKIGAEVTLSGNTVIGDNCNIGDFSTIKNSTIETKVSIPPYSNFENKTIKNNN